MFELNTLPARRGAMGLSGCFDGAVLTRRLAFIGQTAARRALTRSLRGGVLTVAAAGVLVSLGAASAAAFVQDGPDTQAVQEAAQEAPEGTTNAGDSAPLAALPQEDIAETPAALTKALQDIEGYLKSLSSFKARFRQTNPDGRVVRGDFYLKRPGRLRFDFGDDTDYLIVADGNVLSLIDYEIGQITRWPVSDTPLALLLDDTVDIGQLGAQINISPEGRGDYISLTTSDPEKPDQGTVTLFFGDKRRDGVAAQAASGAAGQIYLKAWVVQDAQGRVTFVELEDFEENPDLKDSLWTFKDPRGKRRRTRR